MPSFLFFVLAGCQVNNVFVLDVTLMYDVLDRSERRVDYVLQESFDFSSVRAHTSYWDDHDVALLLLHDIVSSGDVPVVAQRQQPQQQQQQQ